MVYHRFHTREMDELAGLGKRMPIWATFMVIFAFASVGLPGLNGFVGEFLTLLGTFTAREPLGPIYAAVAALGLILGAIYMLYMLGRVVMGPVRISHQGHGHHGHGEAPDLNIREIATLTPLAIACLVIGLYPTPMLRSFEPSIDVMARDAREVVARQAPAPAPAPHAADDAADKTPVAHATQEVAR
jgi:NADH-quinone oxidoreductase subunit M